MLAPTSTWTLYLPCANLGAGPKPYVPLTTELEAFLNTLSFLSSHRLHATHVIAESNALRRSLTTYFLFRSHQVDIVSSSAKV
jgi:hypothetical protein